MKTISGSDRQIAIKGDGDLIRAVLQLHQSAAAYGFSTIASHQMATALSELARNILKYAGSGWIELHAIKRANAVAIEIVARDRGPGIADIPAAMRDHMSTGGTLGLGLPGVQRMMDEFEITSERGRGTRVTVRKWR